MKWMSFSKRISLLIITLHLSLLLFVKPIPQPTLTINHPIKVNSIKVVKRKKKQQKYQTLFKKIAKMNQGTVTKGAIETPSDQLHLSSTTEEDINSSIFVTLQERIELPKNGSVKLNFATDSRGCICSLKVIECEEEENKIYIEHLLKGMPLRYKNFGPITLTLRGVE